MSTTDILTAGIEHLQDLGLTHPVAWPGITFTPPATGMWVEFSHFPNEGRDLVWDNDGCQQARGFFQAMVGYRPGLGNVQASELADLIIDHFVKGTVLGPVRVMKKPWQSPPIVEGDKLYIPVTIRYSGLTK